jgi:hypothetical protein
MRRFGARTVIQQIPPLLDAGDQFSVRGATLWFTGILHGALAVAPCAIRIQHCWPGPHLCISGLQVCPPFDESKT